MVGGSGGNFGEVLIRLALFATLFNLILALALNWHRAKIGFGSGTYGNNSAANIRDLKQGYTHCMNEYTVTIAREIHDTPTIHSTQGAHKSEIEVLQHNGTMVTTFYPFYGNKSVPDSSTKFMHDTQHGTSKYSLAGFKTWTVSPRAAKIEDFGQIPWHVWAIVICHAPPPSKKGKKIFVWDPVAGVREWMFSNGGRSLWKQQNSARHRPKCG
ncbi:hypothetical protein B0H14DRAFT_2629793 [Mycena olivaceomarginata]|nr:hypothetical protein B0H14DRAFT_2629793 [Mycena olivaceomarginata]